MKNRIAIYFCAVPYKQALINNKMKNLIRILILLGCFGVFFLACGTPPNSATTEEKKDGNIVRKVNIDYFSSKNNSFSIETIDCKLSNGTKSKCFKITTKSLATDHTMGPWCPETISDDKSKGGYWFKDGQMYSVDGQFIQELAALYDDQKWLMYDQNGHIFKTKTKEECLKLAGAQLLEEFTNYCIECLPEYVADLEKTFIIPMQPVLLENPIMLGAPPKGRLPHEREENSERPSGPPPGSGRRGSPSIRGIALNGVVFDAPAPVSLILSGYTIPPLDEGGGHINMDAGYHYHAATGLSTEIKQADGHAPLIGYAMDGIGIYAHKNTDGNTPNDLDDCRGHYDETRGYHYHVDEAGNNNFINCFSGAIAE